MVIADSGFWLAIHDRGDPFYERACMIGRDIEEPLVTTWPVLTEVCHLLLHRRGILAMLRFLEVIFSGGCQLFNLSENHFGRIQELTKKYRQLPMDLADASLVVLAEHLGHGRILTTDTRDFRTFRWKNNKPFIDLMYEAGNKKGRHTRP